MAAQDPYDPNDPRLRVLDQFTPSPGIAGGTDPNARAVTTPSPTFAPQPYSPQQRDKIVQGWTASPFAQTRQGIEQYLSSLGNEGAGWSLRSDDKVLDPGGRTFDWIGNVNTPQAQKRTGYTTDARYANVTGSKAKAAPTTSTTTSTTAPAAAAAGAAQGSAYQNQIRDLIMQQLQQLQKPVSADDPAIAAQQNAYRLSRDRDAQQTRGIMAERAAAEGLNSGGSGSGAFDTTVQGIYETAGQDKAENLSGLMGEEQQAKRSQLTTLLNIALQSGDAESVRQLQMQLAQLDATLTREGRVQQNNQFNANLGQNRYMYDDTQGFNQSRSAEDDYRFRTLLALGG
jgi:hypothetical protein